MIFQLMKIMAVAGAAMVAIGIVGGGMELLSGDAPLMFAASGLAIIYAVLACAGASLLWRMDE